MQTVEKANLAWSEERKREIAELRKRYETAQAMLLPVLWMAQEDFGWISCAAMELVAETCESSPAWVYSLATFYTMFELQRPIRYHIQVCHNLSCALCGSDDILAHLEERLGIKRGEATEDGQFRLTGVECLASCGTGPMMQVNDAYYENLTRERVDELLEEWKRA
jgi:NADH-quinone oxidoreductase E subunit